MSERPTMLRRAAPLLIVAAGFVLVPLLVHRFSPDELRTTMLDLREAPRPLPPVESSDRRRRKNYTRPLSAENSFC